MALDDPKQPSEQKRAVALHYKDENQLPQVLASGSSHVAERIIALAQENGIPIHEDKLLAEMLTKVGVGSAISKESYRLVAEVISFLYHLNEEWRSQHLRLGRVLGAPIGERSSER